MLTLRVHSVLAGAYLNGRRGRSVLPKNCLTHLGITSPEGQDSSGCRVPLDHLSDLDEPGEPTCRKCLRRYRSLLRSGFAERALFNSGDCRPNMTREDLER